MREAARERLAAVGADIDVDQPVGELSVGRRQMVAIAKALTYASQHPGHGRADSGADRGRGRAAVPCHARDRRPRRRHRLHLASAGGGAARRRPRHRVARRPGRRRCAGERAAVGTRADAGRTAARPNSIRSAARTSASRCCGSNRRGFDPRRVRAGWQAPVDVSLDGSRPARSSGSPASWAPAGPSCYPPSTATPGPGDGLASSRSTADRRASPLSGASRARRDRLRHRRPARQRPDAARQRRPQPRR